MCGFTYRVADGLFPATGLSVSVAGERGVKFHIGELTASKLADFVELHAAALQGSDIHLGAWYNKKDETTGEGDDNVYLDIAKVVPEASEALDIAVAEDQIAYFNLETGEEVVVDYPTGYQHGPNWQGEGGAGAVEGGLPDSGGAGVARQGAERQGDVAGGTRGGPGDAGRGEPKPPGRPVTLFQAPLPEVDPDQLLVAPTEAVDGRWRNSSRVPTNVKRAPSTAVLHTFLEALEASPGVHAKAATEFRNSRLVRPSALRNLNDKAAIRAAINTMKGNLKFLWEQMDPAVRARARAWYLGGHRLAGEFADEFGTTLAQMAGVIAVNSPQKDWNQNISLARRVLETMTRLDTKDSELIDRWVEPDKQGELAEASEKTAECKPDHDVTYARGARDAARGSGPARLGQAHARADPHDQRRRRRDHRQRGHDRVQDLGQDSLPGATGQAPRHVHRARGGERRRIAAQGLPAD